MKNLARYIIWEINLENNDLEYLKGLLTLDYNQSISYLDEFEDLTPYDRTLQNKWTTPEGTQDFTVKSFMLSNPENDLNVDYIHAKALFEKRLGPDKAIINGTPIPRESRVFNYSCDVCFLKFEERMYSVLKINKSDESRLRNVLFKKKGEDNKNKWGELKYNNPHGYKLESDLFYWLLYKKDQTEEITFEDSKKYRVMDVSLMIQKDKLDTYTTHSIGEDVLGSTGALSSLGENQLINETQIGFVGDDTKIFSIIDNKSMFNLDVDDSYLNVGEEEDEFIKNAMFLYTHLIPELKKAFQTEKDNDTWNDELARKKRKDWAIEAILNLCEINEISIEEIENKMVVY
ncbi:hypothetical protein ACBR55_11985 [Salinicoccus roseus]|uniref:hypothetical protein n=1 Tax=Salinicoccus roseus TaxID=45670 RepID=UPI003523F15E